MVGWSAVATASEVIASASVAGKVATAWLGRTGGLPGEGVNGFCLDVIGTGVGGIGFCIGNFMDWLGFPIGTIVVGFVPLSVEEGNFALFGMGNNIGHKGFGCVIYVLADFDTDSLEEFGHDAFI